MRTRTEEQHRQEVEAWRAKAPANDHEIFPRTRHSQSPRHAGLSDQLRCLLDWKRLATIPDPLQTTWMHEAANDNDRREDNEPPEPALIECELEVRPTIGEIMQALKGVQFDTKGVPSGGDVEYGNGTVGPITRLGGLRFAGEYALKADSPRRGALLAFEYRPGKWRRCVDAFGKPKCPTNQKDITDSNAHFAQILGTAPHRYVTRNSGVKRTVDPRLAALPCGGRRVADSFLSCQIADAETGPGLTPEDIVAERQEAAWLRGHLSRHDVKVLDTALECPSFKALGERLGYNDKAAERQGKRHLLTAAKNLDDLIRKMEASPSLFAYS